ncbi:MAG: hypothetical protein NTY98_18630 [Verrucomicrobia bacterium]|nr:hypothetical protein [Verrucomicrobiota bacterium]
MLRYILLWFVMLIIAIGNGVLRETTFGKRMTELRAHQLSTLIGAVLMGVFIRFVIQEWPPSSGGAAFTIGAVWLCLTVVFECFMGLVLRKRPLAEVLADYNLLAGRVWVLLLLWIMVAPWLFFVL